MCKLMLKKKSNLKISVAHGKKSQNLINVGSTFIPDYRVSRSITWWHTYVDSVYKHIGSNSSNFLAYIIFQYHKFTAKTTVKQTLLSRNKTKPNEFTIGT